MNIMKERDWRKMIIPSVISPAITIITIIIPRTTFLVR
jgi:hypothetical protein